MSVQTTREVVVILDDGYTHIKGSMQGDKVHLRVNSGMKRDAVEFAVYAEDLEKFASALGDQYRAARFDARQS